MQPRKLSSVPARRRGQKTVAGRCRPIPVAFSEEKKPRRSSAVAQLLRSLCRSPPAIERREPPCEGRAQGLIVVFVVVCRARSAKVPVGALISPPSLPKGGFAPGTSWCPPGPAGVLGGKGEICPSSLGRAGEQLRCSSSERGRCLAGRPGVPKSPPRWKGSAP